ncbi:hypothetical protein ScalyP_jg5752 [Parmales sp. scaly parma]|nr:hypothetical protein ScalyP_jg5752 [Parmales sp. scaly parma]
MARGNQRDQAREKNLKKLAAANGGDGREGTKLQRDEADKAALALKVIAKSEKAKLDAEKAALAEGNEVVKPKKKEKKVEAGLDDLLSAGLTGKKKKK